MTFIIFKNFNVAKRKKNLCEESSDLAQRFFVPWLGSVRTDLKAHDLEFRHGKFSFDHQAVQAWLVILSSIRKRFRHSRPVAARCWSWFEVRHSVYIAHWAFGFQTFSCFYYLVGHYCVSWKFKDTIKKRITWLKFRAIFIMSATKNVFHLRANPVCELVLYQILKHPHETILHEVIFFQAVIMNWTLLIN